MLLRQTLVSEVSLRLPAQVEASLAIHGQNFSKTQAQCFVVKDAGDDPDVTNGIEIYAQAEWNDKQQVEIVAGKGIGRVTKRGLQVPVGEPAINPVPMQQIKDAIQEEVAELLEEQGLTVTISIPQGEEVAKKTLNAKLGVLGGISVLGTTGIVKPMSEEAFKNALAVELSVVKAFSPDSVVFVLGNYGKHFVEKHFPQLSEKIVVISNFVGFMLTSAAEKQFKRILLVGNLGKLVKVAGGIFHTHSKVADARNEILASHYMLHSKNAEAFVAIMESNTTEDALDHISDFSFFNHFSNTIKKRCEEHIKGELQVETIVFSLKEGLLGESDGAFNWGMKL